MESTSRQSHILQFTPPDNVIDTYGLIRAYCACLTPEEAAELLLSSSEDRLDIRDAVLRRVCADTDIAFRECHENLIGELLIRLNSATYRGRQSLGYCLSVLATHMPPPERRKIQTAFLHSKYIGIRRRAYKSIALNLDILFEEVEAAWKLYSDPECAWLITKTFPIDFLTAHRAELEHTFTEGWQLSRFYLRIGETSPSVLEDLKSRDEISYCYVLAKLKRPLQTKEAIEIINRRSNDERFGLLVWSLGQMKLWTALQHIEAQLATIEKQRFEVFKNQYGIK